jgi:hypothetical protein
MINTCLYPSYHPVELTQRFSNKYYATYLVSLLYANSWSLNTPQPLPHLIASWLTSDGYPRIAPILSRLGLFTIHDIISTSDHQHLLSFHTLTQHHSSHSHFVDPQLTDTSTLRALGDRSFLPERQLIMCLVSKLIHEVNLV